MLTPERRLMYRRIVEKASDREFTAKAIGQMLADLDEKDALISKLSERVAAQSELLSRKAKASPLFDRVVEALRKTQAYFATAVVFAADVQYRHSTKAMLDAVLAEIAAKGA